MLKMLKKSEKFNTYAKDNDLLIFIFTQMPTIINSLFKNQDF